MQPHRIEPETLSAIESMARTVFPHWWQRGVRASFVGWCESLCRRAAIEALRNAEHARRSEDEARRLANILMGRHGRL